MIALSICCQIWKRKRKRKNYQAKFQSFMKKQKNNCKIIKYEKNVSGSKDKKWFLNNIKK